jgi:hypothetical protein
MHLPYQKSRIDRDCIKNAIKSLNKDFEQNIWKGDLPLKSVRRSATHDLSVLENSLDEIMVVYQVDAYLRPSDFINLRISNHDVEIKFFILMTQRQEIIV